MLSLCLALGACDTMQLPAEVDGRWGHRPVGAPPHPNPRTRQTMVALAEREWIFFGRQIIAYDGPRESIPLVGTWEDDDQAHSERVRAYWRAVGRPAISGRDCQQPWSAAFIGWIMQQARVPARQFRRSQAHWVYLADSIDKSEQPGRIFVPRRLVDYGPQPGDLICATRADAKRHAPRDYVGSNSLRGQSLHCDLVVRHNGRSIEVIGGNVRNSVSRLTLMLDNKGHLRPMIQRPWFIILENRL